MIRIKDILSMEYAKEFVVVSGNEGLKNVVKNVGINDYETLEDIPKVFGNGDFLLTSLALYMRNSAGIDLYLKAFMDAGVAGIGIKNINLGQLSDEIIEYSNRKRIPIIITPKNLYTEDLIVFVKSLIKQDEDFSYLESKILKALEGGLSEQEERKLFEDINPQGNEEISVYYLKKNNNFVEIDNDYKNLVYKYDELLPHLGVIVSKYRDGILVFKNKYSVDTIDKLLYNYGVSINNYAVGIYDHRVGEKSSLKKILENSISAADACICERRECMNYNDIGVYKYILPLDYESNLYREYKRRFEPIVVYDAENETHLVETALYYVKNNGDIRQTSEELFQHVNTIRYRIKRIRELLGYEPEMFSEFYVDLVMMTKLYKIICSDRTSFV